MTSNDFLPVEYERSTSPYHYHHLTQFPKQPTRPHLFLVQDPHTFNNLPDSRDRHSGLPTTAFDRSNHGEIQRSTNPAALPHFSEPDRLQPCHSPSCRTTSTDSVSDATLVQQHNSEPTVNLSLIDLWLRGQEEASQPLTSTSGFSYPPLSSFLSASCPAHQSRKRKRTGPWEAFQEDYISANNIQTITLPLTQAHLQLLAGISLHPYHEMPPNSDSVPTTRGLHITSLLEANRMPMEDEPVQSTEAYRSVIQASEERIAPKRHSPEKDAKAGNWKSLAAQYKVRSEQTFIEIFFLAVSQQTRNIQVKNNDGTVTDNPLWQERSYMDDGIDINICQPFQRGSLPKVDPQGNKIYKKLLESHIRIKNPVPDRCYGLAEKVFTSEEMHINRLLNIYTGISPLIYHPAIAIEFGLHKDTIELEAQCARGGAALVNALRSVRSAAGENIMTQGADQDSVIYTFAIKGEVAYLHVNWAFVEDDTTTTFHMHLLKEFSLRSASTIVEMRAALDNLKDWLVGERKSWIKQLLQKIIERGVKAIVKNPVVLEKTTTEDSGASGADKDEEEEENDGDAEGADSVSAGQTANKKRKSAGRT